MRVLNGLMGRPVTWLGLADLPENHNTLLYIFAKYFPSYAVYSQRRRADPTVFEGLVAMVLYGSLIVAYDPYAPSSVIYNP